MQSLDDSLEMVGARSWNSVQETVAAGRCAPVILCVIGLGSNTRRYWQLAQEGTAEPLEQAQLDIGNAGQFERTGAWFNAGGTVPVCRFYGSATPGPNSHFFSAERAECDALRGQQVVPAPTAVPQWNYEGLGFLVTPARPDAAGALGCPAGTVAVYRGYNSAFTQAGKRPWDSNHRYATSPMAINNLVTQFGWRNEGLVFCTPSQ